jgi:transcription initiation factor TFIIIB Brf1 subunit/transcription initiation factor TFIIB
MLGKTYCCPDCHGTEVVWDMGTAKAICPKDGTPVSKYQSMD